MSKFLVVIGWVYLLMAMIVLVLEILYRSSNDTLLILVLIGLSSIFIVGSILYSKLEENKSR